MDPVPARASSSSQASPMDEKPPPPQQPRQQTRATQRTSNACEACRTAKLRCQPGPSGSEGTCRRCLEFKRECVFRLGVRTRMSKGNRMNSNNQPDKNRPSQTFSIDFEVDPDDDPHLSFDSLTLRHESYIEDFLPSSPSPSPPFLPQSQPPLDFSNPLCLASSTPQQQSAASSPPVSSSSVSAFPPPRRTMQAFGMQPQFNLDSATSLLAYFRTMLPFFPCIVLPEDATVASLARERPFVLLAILASASGCRTVQGHGLYDEEFRKVLGLKYVAGGERCLEMLQGLLVYCAWYPFHLRPKNKQAFQYIRMAADIVQDLELDRCPSGTDAQVPITADHIDGIRTYLSCYYLVSTFAAVWKKLSTPNLKYTPWTQTCWDALAKLATSPSDLHLSYLARQTYLVYEAAEISRFRKSKTDNDQKARVLMLGLESQEKKWRDQIPTKLAASAIEPLNMSTLFTQVYLASAPLLQFPTPKIFTRSIPPDPAKLKPILPVLRRYFEASCNVDHAIFSAIDWAHFVLCVVLAMRISFPLRGVPIAEPGERWDDSAAREELRFGETLQRLCGGNDKESEGPGKAMDIGEAGRVILRVVKKKFDGQAEKIRRAEERRKQQAQEEEEERLRAEQDVSMKGFGCPLIDGSMDDYFAIWEHGGEPSSLSPQDILGGGMSTMGMMAPMAEQDIPRPVPGWQHDGSWSGSGSGTGSMPEESYEEGYGAEAGRLVYHDLWATMTVGWASGSDSSGY